MVTGRHANDSWQWSAIPGATGYIQNSPTAIILTGKRHHGCQQYDARNPPPYTVNQIPETTVVSQVKLVSLPDASHGRSTELYGKLLLSVGGWLKILAFKKVYSIHYAGAAINKYVFLILHSARKYWRDQIPMIVSMI